MDAYFSGTDWNNLEDRAHTCNYFVMLIVNFSGNYVAKVAFKAKKAETNLNLEFFNNMDGLAGFTLPPLQSTEVLVVMDCIVKFEVEAKKVDETFLARLDTVRESVKESIKDPAPKSTILPTTTKSDFKSARDDWKGKNQKEQKYWTSGSEWEQGEMGFKEVDKELQKKGKAIMEMTEQEYIDFMKERKTEKDTDDIFELTHARMALNYALGFCDEGYPSMACPSDPIESLLLTDKKMITSGDISIMLTGMEDYLEEWVEDMHPEKSDDKYLIQLLDKIIQLLYPSKYCRLTNSIIKRCESWKIDMIEGDLEKSDDQIADMIQKSY